MKTILFGLLTSLLIVVNSNANATIILSGDVSIGSSINNFGDDKIVTNPNNALWFTNILANGTKVFVHNESDIPGVENAMIAIHSHFDNLNGVTSTFFNPTITSSLLANIDLFISALPANPYTKAERIALQSFIDAGGTLMLLGDNNFAAAANARINELLEGLNSTLRLGTDFLDSGYRTTPNLLDHPFNNGISDLTYNYVNSVSGGTPLVNTRDGVTFIATESNRASVSEPSSMLLMLLISMVLLRLTREPKNSAKTDALAYKA